MDDQRKLEVKVVFLDGLKKRRCIRKGRRYHVVAWVNPLDKQSTNEVAGVHSVVWNQTLVLLASEAALHHPSCHLTLQIYVRRFIRYKCVGVVTIPFPELLSNSEEECIKSYQARRRSGRRSKATLQLSLRLSEKFCVFPPLDEPVTAYPATAYLPRHVCLHNSTVQTRYQGYPHESYYAALDPPRRVRCVGGTGFATGLAAGAVEGLVIGDVIHNVSCHDRDFDDGFWRLNAFGLQDL